MTINELITKLQKLKRPHDQNIFCYDVEQGKVLTIVDIDNSIDEEVHLNLQD